MSPSTLHHSWLTLAGPGPGDLLTLTPEKAGWTYCGLRIIRLEPGELRRVDTGGEEMFVLPLVGGLTIEVAPSATPSHTEVRVALTGRASVFDRVTDFAYVGRDSHITMVSANGAEVALPSARCENRLPPKYGAADDVTVEIRGAGPATRQVNAFGAPGLWDHADRLVAVELAGLPVCEVRGPRCLLLDAPADVVARSWTAQQRLHRKYARLAARGKPKQHVVTAVARELTGFVWAALTQ